MPREPFPDRNPDDPDPDRSGWRRVHEGEPPSDSQACEQGLFVCLPAEEVTLAGFAQNGRSDTMAPSPLLATILETVTGQDGSGLAALSDDQLMGVLSGIRRTEARAAWGQLAVLAELARRRPAAGDANDRGQRGFSDFAPDEVAFELRLSTQSAAGQMMYAVAVDDRLPCSFAALSAGQIHPVHLRIIEDETRILSPEHAAQADEILAGKARTATYGELRYAARRLVLKLDPDAARRRKETAARRDAEVRRFREDSGNAGMIARELPCDEVLASWQHVDQRARDLRAAGMPGSIRELRIRAYLDLLQERDSRPAPADPDEAGTEADPGGNGGPPDRDDGGGPGGDGGSGPGPGQRGPAGTGPGGYPRQARSDQGPSVAALINITVSLDTATGRSTTPGEVAGYGPLDPDDMRALLAAAARHPDTRWCVTALYPDGTAAAHGCARGRHPPPPAPSPIGPDPPPGSTPQDYLAGLRVQMTPVSRGHCDHTRAESGYRPSRALAHLIEVRNTRCTAPGCGQPAARCDLDHTLAWDNGGPTCECDLAPLCRHHHRAKQAHGWLLEQPEPGVLRWRTPPGRTYTTKPTAYPI